ncbi:MAG: phage major capsid protein, partial [Oscillospiraceae bacterium]
MALKVLLLRQKLSAKQKELSELRTVSENFITREAELETAITEAMTDEERSTVENLVTAFEAERDTNTTDIERVSGEIADIENEIAEVEKATGTARAKPVNGQERTKTIMENAETRTHFFGMTVRERDDFIARDDVKEFTKRMRELKNQNRGVTGAELGIPTIMLDILRSNIDQYSKLMKYVRLRKLSGKARQSICGVVPEAVWTEATGALNDLDVVFTQVEVDGYKLGGYLAIPNSLIEDDDDVQLLMEVMVQMGQAIGKGVDKSIVYGDGVKMPVGFATRLAATSKPAWWGSNQGAFTDLHLSNVKKLSIAASSGVNFFRSLI